MNLNEIWVKYKAVVTNEFWWDRFSITQYLKSLNNTELNDMRKSESSCQRVASLPK